MRYLIVDGHSVIFAWPELRKLHARRMILARDELAKILTQYQDTSGVRVVVVFDGKSGTAAPDSAPGGIQILYSATGQTADQIIERLAGAYGRQYDLTVATDDMLEQQTVAALGAYPLSTEGLRDRLAEASSDFRRELRARRSAL